MDLTLQAKRDRSPKESHETEKRGDVGPQRPRAAADRLLDSHTTVDPPWHEVPHREQADTNNENREHAEGPPQSSMRSRSMSRDERSLDGEPREPHREHDAMDDERRCDRGDVEERA